MTGGRGSHQSPWVLGLPFSSFSATDLPVMSAQGLQAYKRAVAVCLRDAATMGLIEKVYRFGRKGGRQDITNLGSALLVLDKLVESDGHRRLWMAVEPLSPELNWCVSHIRFMTRVEGRIERGLARLEALQGRTRRTREEWQALERKATDGERPPSLPDASRSPIT